MHLLPSVWSLLHTSDWLGDYSMLIALYYEFFIQNKSTMHIRMVFFSCEYLLSPVRVDSISLLTSLAYPFGVANDSYHEYNLISNTIKYCRFIFHGDIMTSVHTYARTTLLVHVEGWFGVTLIHFRASFYPRGVQSP